MVVAANRALEELNRDSIAEVDATAQDVVDYYRETLEDYRVWSRLGYMHFGYWRLGVSPFDRQSMLESMNDRAFADLDLDGSTPLSIGDLGCGVGAVTRYGARKYPLHNWLGVTLSDKQIEQAVKADSPTNCRFLLADYHRLPLADECLNAAFFLESLCHSPDLTAALAEAARVLCPGGRLVVVDGMLHRPLEQTPVAARYLAQVTCRNWAVPRFYSLDEIRKAATAVKLRIRSIQEIGWRIAPSVLHSPLLISWRAIVLLWRRKSTRWQWRHLASCLLGMLLGLHRGSFGYYVCALEK